MRKLILCVIYSVAIYFLFMKWKGNGITLNPKLFFVSCHRNRLLNCELSQSVVSLMLCIKEFTSLYLMVILENRNRYLNLIIFSNSCFQVKFTSYCTTVTQFLSLFLDVKFIF